MPVSIWEGKKADRLTAAVEALALSSLSNINVLSEKGLQQVTRAGLASKYYNYGDQISTKWQADADHEYDLEQDVVAFHNVETEDGAVKPGLWLQSHWALTGVQFDASEAICYAESAALPAGTYHFTIGTTWGTHCVAGKSYQFTTTKEIPVGGQIVCGDGNNFYTWAAPDKAPSGWKVHTFSAPTSVEPLESLGLTEGTGGTDLGTLSNATKYGTTGMNNLQRCAYGYNRWSQSAMRQWLNSDADVGKWWTPQNPYDRPPQQLASIPGFMHGLGKDFLEIVQPVKVVTALNTISDTELGTTEVTYDRFFLPSLEQEYITPQLKGTEGNYWPYWKQRLGLSSPQAQGSGGANAKHIRYAIENHTSAQYVRLRSAYRGYAYYGWLVYTSGHAGSSHATTAIRPAPACVIC